MICALKSSLSIAIFASLLISCGKDATPAKSQSVVHVENLGSASGNFRLIATDAPFSFGNVASAKIIVERAEVKSSAEISTSLIGQPMTLDLVKLTNGMVTVVVDLNLPPGEYKEINLIIESGSIDLKSGEHYNLKIPSGTTSGLKIKLEPAIVISTQASKDILLDFDLSRSFVPQGDSKDAATINGFHFKPVLRAANLTSAGTAKGLVRSDNGTANSADDFKLAGAVVNISQNDAIVSTAITDAFGNYEIIGLPAGAYSVEVTSAGYTSSTPVNVSIVAGNISTVGETLLAKLPEAAVAQ